MATDAIERARARKAAEDTVRKLDLIMKHLGIVDPLAKPEEAHVETKPETQQPDDDPSGEQATENAGAAEPDPAGKEEQK